jgi:hypothetical protein
MVMPPESGVARIQQPGRIRKPAKIFVLAWLGIRLFSACRNEGRGTNILDIKPISEGVIL